MKQVNQEEGKKQREKASLQNHDRLSRLFKENRFIFELERKKMIEEVINSVEDEGRRRRLWELQESWDRKMKGAGSPHNRFVLARTLFWEHFHEIWNPKVQELNTLLNGPGPNKRS